MSLEWRLNPNEFRVGRIDDSDVFASYYDIHHSSCHVGYIFSPPLSNFKQNAEALGRLFMEEIRSPIFEVEIKNGLAYFREEERESIFYVSVTPKCIQIAAFDTEGESLDRTTRFAKRFEELVGGETSELKVIPRTATREVNCLSPCRLDRFSGEVQYTFFRKPRGRIKLEKMLLLSADKSPFRDELLLWGVDLTYIGRSGILGIKISEKTISIIPPSPFSSPFSPPVRRGGIYDPSDRLKHRDYFNWAKPYGKDLKTIENRLISKLPIEV